MGIANLMGQNGGKSSGQYVWAKYPYEAGGIGGIDSYTKLMLHAEDFTDSSPSPNTLTNTNATINTTTKKFGASSMYFNGSAKVNMPYNANLDFGTGDFTIDFWIYVTSALNNKFIMGNATTGAIFVGFQSGNIGIGRSGVAWDNVATTAIPQNQWVHITLARSGTSLKFYHNGTLINTFTNSIDYNLGGGYLNVGADNTSYMTGYVDEFRISKGIARWTAAFTSPTQEYDNGYVKGAFIEYLVSDIADKYPDFGTSGSYWYESVATPADA